MADHSPDSETLWKSFTEGDQAAFEQLFKGYFSILYQYGRKFSSDDEFVKDSIQELFTELWHRQSFLKPTPSVRNYLYKSLRRKMLRLSSNRLPGGELIEGDSRFAITLSPEQIMLDQEASELQKQQMDQWLTYLTPRQREAIYLKFYQDMEYDEIASVMTVNNHTARNLIYEGLKLLRSRLISLFFVLATNLGT